MSSHKGRRTKRRKIRQKLVDLKGGACESCGQKYDACVFDFHHRDPATKRFVLSVSGMTDHSWKDVLEEAMGCTMLCANCHRMLHEKERQNDDAYSGHRNRWVSSPNDTLPLFGNKGYN